MTIEQINIGTTPNDGTGDTLRVGAAKINSNFTEVSGSIYSVSSSVITDHIDLDNIGTTTHDDIDTHIADDTKHFTEGSISITESQVSDLGPYNNYTHPTDDGNKHVPANSTTNSGKVLTAGAVAGTYTWETNSTGVTDHTLLSSIGDNTHAEIDTHIIDIQAEVDLNTAKETNIAHPLVETAVPVGAVFTDTVYDDTTLQAEVDLNTAKVTDVSHPLVETAVPLGAVFTDTVYDDTTLQAEVDLNTADRHDHINSTTLDKFGENVEGLPTYNGLDIDTTIAQRDVYDGLDSLDNTISLSANNGKVLKDVQDTQQTAINLNTAKVTYTDAAVLDVLNSENVISGSGYLLNTTDTLDGDLTVTGTVEASELTFGTGGVVSWNPTDYTIDVDTGIGPVLQVGQERFTIVINNTGTTIFNGDAVHAIGSSNGRPTIALAIANTHTGILPNIAVATMDILDGQVGIVTRAGTVRGLNTLIYSVDDVLWLSPTNEGEFTTTKPSFPDYPVRIGKVIVVGETDGEIEVNTSGSPEDTLVNFWNGIFRESIDFLITSDGLTVTGNLSPANGHPDLTMIFSDGFTTLDTDPVLTIELTPGSDINPQTNYVYILQSTKVLTISTSDWPSTEHIKVATVLLKSALATQNDGALRNQNWNDALQNTTTNQGHLTHITEKLRQGNAQWWTGVELTAAGEPADVYVSVTAGEVYQLHKQIFPALNTQTGDNIHIVNNFATPYVSVSNMNGQTTDALGITLANQSFSFVVWGVANKTGETSHLMCNIPIGSYAKNDALAAVSDASNYSVYDIPKQFQGVGFLIARVTYTLDTGGTVWTVFDTEDLRGKIPNTTAGGGGGGTGVTTSLGLLDTPSTFAGSSEYFWRVNTGETANEFVDINPIILAKLDAENVVSGSNVARTDEDNEFTAKQTITSAVVGEDVLTLAGTTGDLLVVSDVDTGTILTLNNSLGNPIFTVSDLGVVDATSYVGINSYPTADSDKVGFISVTQAVDLDTMESDIATNNDKISYNSTDSTKVAFITVTQDVNLDTIESDTAANNAKVTYPTTDSDKVGFISVTQAVDLDTMESDIATNNAKITYPSTDSDKVAFISVTQAVDLDTMESDIATNNAKVGVAADVIGLNELAAELKAEIAISALDVDWSTGIQFTKTLTVNTTLTFSNYTVGKTITLVIDGDFTLTLPTGVDVTELTDYDSTSTNYIQLYCANATTPVFLASVRVR